MPMEQGRILFRTGTAAEWASRGNSIVLAKGEPGYDSTNGVIKVGDGVHTWAELGGNHPTDPNPTEDIDRKVTPDQKAALLVTWKTIQAEYPTILQRAQAQQISQGVITPYMTAYSNLEAYLEPILSDMTTMTILNEPLGSSGLFEAYAGLRESVLNEINRSINEVTSKVFFEEPVGPYKKGDLWVSDGVLFQAVQDRSEGEFDLADWVWCIRSNITTMIMSSNGDKFRPGQSTTTVLTGRLFKNGVEVTDEYDSSCFKWTKKSLIPDAAGDAMWNADHQSGFKSVEVGIDDINCRAVYTLEILEV